MSFRKNHLVERLQVAPCGKFGFILCSDSWIDTFYSPKSIEEIQGVLQIANEYKIPVWTFSRGKNLG